MEGLTEKNSTRLPVILICIPSFIYFILDSTGLSITFTLSKSEEGFGRVEDTTFMSLQGVISTKFQREYFLLIGLIRCLF